MSKSPTQRTLEWLRDQGYRCQVVERWCPHSQKRIDLFGFADIVAISTNQSPFGVLAVQATSGSNLASRVCKVKSLEAAQVWLDRGNHIWCVGWRQLVQYNKDGRKSKRKRWEPRVVEIHEV